MAHCGIFYHRSGMLRFKAIVSVFFLLWVSEETRAYRKPSSIASRRHVRKLTFDFSSVRSITKRRVSSSALPEYHPQFSSFPKDTKISHHGDYNRHVIRMNQS